MSIRRAMVDNNVLSDLFVGTSDFQEAAESLRRKIPEWVAPPLIRYEFGNVLRTSVRLGKQGAQAAEGMLGAGLGMLRFCEIPAAATIFREANASKLTFYDATYVACARALGLILFTRDEDILKNCPDLARRISDG